MNSKVTSITILHDGKEIPLPEDASIAMIAAIMSRTIMIDRLKGMFNSTALALILYMFKVSPAWCIRAVLSYLGLRLLYSAVTYFASVGNAAEKLDTRD